MDADLYLLWTLQSQQFCGTFFGIKETKNEGKGFLGGREKMFSLYSQQALARF